jgi:polygalacturonase
MHSLYLLTSLASLASAGLLPKRDTCLVTDYSGIATAVASCTDITLQDIYAPDESAIDLRALLPSTTVTFAGNTTFGFTNSSSFTPILITGQNITITAAEGSLIDGNGQAYWDVSFYTCFWE